MMPTRLPSSATGSCGQWKVWKDSPSKSSTPSMRGMVGADSNPRAMMTKRAVSSRPSLVKTCQRFSSSSKCAASTRQSNCM